MRPPHSEMIKSEAEEKVQLGATALAEDTGKLRVQHVLAERWKRERKGEGEQCSRRPGGRRIKYCQGTKFTDITVCPRELHCL